MFTKGSMSTGAKGLYSMIVDPTATPCCELRDCNAELTVNDLEKEKPVFQHEEVLGIHRTLVGIKSPGVRNVGADSITLPENSNISC
ncbi:hypothetical protein Tco_0350817 [Tanacetum coccineum]